MNPNPGELPVDESLVERLKANDPGAFDEFFSLFAGRLLNFGRRMCRDSEDAKEVLQDTLLKAYQSVGSLKNTAAFKSWLFRIAANACLMRRRKSQFLEEEISIDETLPNAGGLPGDSRWEGVPDQVLENSEMRKFLEEAIFSLPPKYRIVALLRDVEGLSTEEVAEALSVGKDVVKMRLHRARAMLRNAIDGRLSAVRGGKH